MVAQRLSGLSVSVPGDDVVFVVVIPFCCWRCCNGDFAVTGDVSTVVAVVGDVSMAGNFHVLINSGINAIFYFSNSIFASAHVSNKEMVTSLVCLEMILFWSVF
jgi:hypothetical protein